MKKIEQLVEIIRQMIKESDDRILNIRGGKGYGTGHTYPNKKEIKPRLGDPGPYEFVEEEEEDTGTVKISKAFKKEDK